MGLPATFEDSREIHVWFVELSADAASVEAYGGSLSEDERERASRFRFEPLRTAFTLARGTLRVLLGRYLAIEPDRILFTYGPNGKPRLMLPGSPLEFNLAHSGRFAAYAFAMGCELGVDIEEIRPLPDQPGIVERFFSREECQDWRSIDPAQRDESFFRCWTRKEAYIKAIGGGLSIPLASFRVSLKPEEPAALIQVDGDTAEAGRWSFWSLTPADGYVGALAVPDRDSSVRILPSLTAGALLRVSR